MIIRNENGRERRNKIEIEGYELYKYSSWLMSLQRFLHMKVNSIRYEFVLMFPFDHDIL